MRGDPVEPLGETDLRIGELRIRLSAPKDIDALLDRAIETAPSDVDAIPYYAWLWPSARALAEYLWEIRGSLRGARTLELGCGLGLPTIVASLLGADATASDFHPGVRAWVERNILLNNASARYQPYDWNDAYLSNQSLLPAEPLPAYLLGSDLLYEKRHIPALVQALARNLAPGGQALIADPGRDNLQLFLDTLQKARWHHQLLVRGDIWIVRCTPPERNRP